MVVVEIPKLAEQLPDAATQPKYAPPSSTRLPRMSTASTGFSVTLNATWALMTAPVSGSTTNVGVVMIPWVENTSELPIDWRLVCTTRFEVSTPMIVPMPTIERTVTVPPAPSLLVATLSSLDASSTIGAAIEVLDERTSEPPASTCTTLVPLASAVIEVPSTSSKTEPCPMARLPPASARGPGPAVTELVNCIDDDATLIAATVTMAPADPLMLSIGELETAMESVTVSCAAASSIVAPFQPLTPNAVRVNDTGESSWSPCRLAPSVREPRHTEVAARPAG
eukprot:Amastigsp_a340768_5.p2 type:complete len:282 gc:universal Amastigsp_a340768_5:957-112(-)